MSNRAKRLFTGVMPLILLILVNFLTFASQFRGQATFPWDFLGGYHAQAVGWFDAGSVLSPPTWLPWADMGFPAFLAIQSGAWYLPLAFLDAVGIPYSIHVATVVQVLHVLLGAFGTYCLGRTLGWKVSLSLVAAVAYHYSATFYSNQQHVDIVRAAALMPWLLLTLHPATLSHRAWGPLISAIVLSQLLVGGYPGNVVSTAYACALWGGFFFLQLSSRAERIKYATSVALVVVAGTLMAMTKWLPVAMFSGSGFGIEHRPPLPMQAQQLLTLVMPYEFDGLPDDVTMRALWLPMVVLWGLAFAGLRDRVAVLGYGLIALAAFMGMVVPRVELLQKILPGVTVSRFPLSDWRPVLHIGLILVGVIGWHRALSCSLSLPRLVVGQVLATTAVVGLLLWAIYSGYPANALSRALVVSSVLVAVGLALTLVRQGFLPIPSWPRVLAIVLLLTTAADGYLYYHAQPRTWNMPWTEQDESALFGGKFDALNGDREQSLIQRRPARRQVGEGVEEILSQRNSLLYNQCWYGHSFCTFGYNNLRMSEPHRKFGEAAADVGGAALLAFAGHRQQLLVLPPGSDDKVPDDASSLAEADAIGQTDGFQVEFLRYSNDTVEYRIKSNAPRVVVENEIWWQGWKVELCNQGACLEELPTVATRQALRSWKIPSGSWNVRVQYHAPSVVPGYICWLLGFFLVLGIGAMRLMRQRKRAHLE